MTLRKKKSSAKRALPEPARIDLQSVRASRMACLAVCGYWMLFGIPSSWDFSLILLAVATAWSAICLVENKSSHFYPILIALFIGAILLSVPGSPDIARSLHFILVLPPSLMIFYLLSEKIERRHLVWVANWLVLVTVFLGMVLLGIAWVSDSGGPGEWVKQANMTFFHVPNDVVMLMILAPFALVSLVNKPKSLMGAVGAIGLLASTAVAVVYRSRLSVLLLVFGLVIAGLVMGGRKKILLGLPVLLALLLTFDVLSGGFLLSKMSSTWDTRLPLWFASWCLFLEAPYFGGGPGSYLLEYRDCLAQLIADGSVHLEDPRIAPWAHNLYLEVLTEQGLTGFFSMIALLTYGIVGGYRVLSRVEGSMGRVGSSALVSLIVFCVAANFELSLWRQWVTVVLFTLIGIVAGIHRVCHLDEGVK